MGNGSYSTVSRGVRSESLGYKTKPAREIFKQTSVTNLMDPKDIEIREARDNEEHPNSVPIVLALDVTGSMGSIPHHLVKEGLPHIMSNIIQLGVKDPQMLFLGIGDHECDKAPLQVGQFESSDELLDKWLTDIYLEGGGGGNYGESYLLAWFFAGLRTVTDSFEKRGLKGFLFTIGDEPTLKDIPSNSIKEIMGVGQYKDYSASELLDIAREKYHVFHLHLKQGHHGSNQKTIDDWKQLMGENLILVNDSDEICKIIPEIIKEYTTSKVSVSEDKKEEVML